VYERKVTRQQQEILSTANRSHAIVSSMFPSNVRDQLYSNQDKSSMRKKNLPGPSIQSIAFVGPAIAELYPETTVLFTDIVSFTKWSSGKTWLHFLISLVPIALPFLIRLDPLTTYAISYFRTLIKQFVMHPRCSCCWSLYIARLIPLQLE
jgi:hypothetical protein